MVSRVEEQLVELVEPIVVSQNDLLWDLTYSKEGGQKILRILVDKKDHQFITMADITTITEEISEMLDTVEPDPLPEAYMLDISSPGADRPLKQPWHFRWAKESDENILVSLFAAKNGQKKWQGKLISVDDDGICLLADSKEITLAFDEIAKAILDVQF